MDWFLLLILAIPVCISVITEVLKRLPKVPVSNNNAKWVVLIIALVGVLITYADFGSATQTITNIKSGVPSIATEVGLFYASAIGFYETFRKLVEKI